MNLSVSQGLNEWGPLVAFGLLNPWRSPLGQPQLVILTMAGIAKADTSNVSASLLDRVLSGMALTELGKAGAVLGQSDLAPIARHSEGASGLALADVQNGGLVNVEFDTSGSVFHDSATGAMVVFDRVVASTVFEAIDKVGALKKP